MIRTLTRTRSALAALSLAALAAPALAQPGDPDALERAADKALASDALAYGFTEGLTTEVGPRQAGTPDEARARAWAMAWLKAHGFANVAEEPFAMQTWVPGDIARARVTGPFAQDLVVLPLGDSAATPVGGIEGEVVFFPSIEDLRAAPEGSLKGKIAYISHQMRAAQDGSHYGFAGPVRWVGPGIAAAKGAVAAVIKSVGTDHHRNPHTGGTDFVAGIKPIPAGALSLPDADNLERMFARAGGKPVTLRLELNPRQLGTTMSGNVVGEIVGRNPALPPVLLACHLDSWWNSPGAFDDAAGCGIIAAAAKTAGEAGQPLRTIRVLFAGAEEVGLHGSVAYAKAHINEPIAVGLESDFGADRIWRFQSNFAASNPALHARLARAVARFGVANSPLVAAGGADLNIVRDQQGALINLQQDGTRYFDLHHTPDDTLDKIDLAQMRQNVAVWATVVGVLANEASGILTGTFERAGPDVMKP